MRRPRPGGRTERNRKLVANAVLELIQAGNLDFEIQDVAALSGVHRTTIFRRWPDRGALIAEAMTEHVAQFNLKTTGDWRHDLKHFAVELGNFFSSPVEIAMNKTLVSSNNDALRAQMDESWGPILHTMRVILDAGIAQGEVRKSIDTDIIVSMVIAPLFTLSLVGGEMPGSSVDLSNFAERLVTQVIEFCELK